METGTVNKLGYAVRISCLMGSGTCTGGGGACANGLAMDNGSGVLTNITSTTLYTTSEGVSRCWYGDYVFQEYGLGRFRINNCSIRSQGNTTGCNGGVGFIYYYLAPNGIWSDAMSGNNTDRVAPNVTMDIPSNNTIENVTTTPWQENFSCTVSDLGYLSPNGWLNFTVRNATTGTILNSTLFHGSNYSHTWTAMMVGFNYTSMEYYNWSCEALDEAQNRNSSIGNFTFLLKTADFEDGSEWLLRFIVIFGMLGVVVYKLKETDGLYEKNT